MTMYAEERQQAMAQLVAERGRLSVNVLAETVRRHYRDRPSRPFGPRAAWAWYAACTAAPSPPTPWRSSSRGSASATMANTAQKERIARAALDLLPPAGSTVLLDAGSTTNRFASLLPRDHRLVVVTHAVPVAARLAGNPQIELHLLPGRVRTTTQAAVGVDTVAALQHLRADVAFLGTNALTVGARPVHAGPRRGRHQAGHGRERPAGRRPRGREQDRRRVLR